MTDLWWLMLAIATAIFVLVCVLIAVAFVRARHGGEAAGPVSWGNPFILLTGVVMTGLILVGVFLLSVREMNDLATAGEGAELEIEVVAHDWWWEARYPNGAVVANEIHIPAGEPVRLTLDTADVIHSFWVPQLAAKVDMIPGRTNEMWLQADEPGRYRGQCAEFCGLQHANMLLFVQAQSPDAFGDWVERQAEPAVAAEGRTASRGQRVFESFACAGCHAIRGTEADGGLGPDLTHLASRETIAAGILANTETNLLRWILDPQEDKPGVSMPPADLPAEDLDALVAYLMGLE